jgi:DNA-binding response OmpR family regulator
MSQPVRLLVVEDDKAISRLLQLELTHRGMQVDVAPDGTTGYELAAQQRHDVILLDILMPGMDGERLLAKIRREGIRTPVIMVTARDADRDKVRNLETGADDYLTKPFNIDELVARIRAILRRTQPPEQVTIADLRIDIDTREVRRNGRPIDLTAREFDLLLYLARNGRTVLTRAQILDAVWSERPDVDPNVIDVYIGYLRKKIDAPGLPRLIHTVRGVGFSIRE